MTASAIEKLLKRRHSQPFNMIFSNGKAYLVDHPENCIIAREFALVLKRSSPDGVVDDFDYLSYLHIASAEPVLTVSK